MCPLQLASSWMGLGHQLDYLDVFSEAFLKFAQPREEGGGLCPLSRNARSTRYLMHPKKPAAPLSQRASGDPICHEGQVWRSCVVWASHRDDSYPSSRVSSISVLPPGCGGPDPLPSSASEARRWLPSLSGAPHTPPALWSSSQAPSGLHRASSLCSVIYWPWAARPRAPPQGLSPGVPRKGH